MSCNQAWWDRQIRYDPITAIAGILSAIGVGLEVEGRQDQAKEERRESREQAELMRRDAELEARRTRRLRGTQRARFGAAGVSPGSGSAEAVGLQAFSDLVLEQERILTGATLVARAGRRRARALERDAFGALVGGALDTATLYSRTRDD